MPVSVQRALNQFFVSFPFALRRSHFGQNVQEAVVNVEHANEQLEKGVEYKKKADKKKICIVIAVIIIIIIIALIIWSAVKWKSLDK